MRYYCDKSPLFLSRRTFYTAIWKWHPQWYSSRVHGIFITITQTFHQREKRQQYSFHVHREYGNEYHYTRSPNTGRVCLNSFHKYYSLDAQTFKINRFGLFFLFKIIIIWSTSKVMPGY